MTFTGSKIFFEFDPFELVGMTKPKRGARDARQEIADLVLTEVLDYVGEARSPIQSGRWKSSLSKEYKKRKADWSSSLVANMELTGDMLDSLEVWEYNGKLRLGIRDSREAKKADGHNNHSGRSSLPAREFIPKEGQTFKRRITDAMRQIIREYGESDDT